MRTASGTGKIFQVSCDLHLVPLWYSQIHHWLWFSQDNINSGAVHHPLSIFIDFLITWSQSGNSGRYILFLIYISLHCFCWPCLSSLRESVNMSCYSAKKNVINYRKNFKTRLPTGWLIVEIAANPKCTLTSEKHIMSRICCCTTSTYLMRWRIRDFLWHPHKSMTKSI